MIIKNFKNNQSYTKFFIKLFTELDETEELELKKVNKFE